MPDCRIVFVCAAGLFAACSASVATRDSQAPSGGSGPGPVGGVGGRTADGDSDRVPIATGNPGSGSAGTIAANGDALTVRIEDVQRMSIEIITLACAGDCADVEAVARGGNAPYTFEWDDGTKDAKRRLCLDEGKKLRVTAKDTAIEAAEFGYAAQIASAEVTANVLDCTDAGVPPTPGAFCIENPSLEGKTGFAEFGWDLPGWETCYLTPDVSPLVSTIPASDGATYIAFQTAGDALLESAGTSFCSPLEAGRPISFSVDIGVAAITPGPGQLELWGGSTSCSKDELLWKSPVVSDVDQWHTFCGTLTPTKSYPYLVLWSVFSGTADYLIVDNFRPKTSCP